MREYSVWVRMAFLLYMDWWMGFTATFYIDVFETRLKKNSQSRDGERTIRQRARDTGEFYQLFDCLGALVSLLMVPEISSE